MSKSASSELNWIALDESPDKVRKKVKVAVTDSGRDVAYDAEKKAAVSNLMTIYSEVTGETLDQVRDRFAGKGYGDFKKELAERVVEFLAPIQSRLADWRGRPPDVHGILPAGAKPAR